LNEADRKASAVLRFDHRLRVRDWLRWKGVQMKSEDAARKSDYTGPINVMTVREVSAYLRVHPSTIYRLVKRNQIPAFHVGSDWRFNVEQIESWRLQQQERATEAGD
jgi:excisionase family DNA binding protein